MRLPFIRLPISENNNKIIIVDKLVFCQPLKYEEISSSVAYKSKEAKKFQVDPVLTLHYLVRYIKKYSSKLLT